jgi:serine phosphatase RsbU (regulator of sigma subunit)
MKRAERILGILSMGSYILGLVFRYLQWPGGSLLVVSTLGLFILGYLPLNYILQRRTGRSLPERIFLSLKIMTFALIMMGAVFIIMHWPGGEAFLFIGMILLLPLIVLNYYLRTKGYKRLHTGFNELVIGMLALGIFFYVNRPRASKYTLERNRMMLAQVETRIAGIERANQVIYESLDSLNLEHDPVLVVGIIEVRAITDKMLATYDSIVEEFIAYCNEPYGGTKDDAVQRSITSIEPVALTLFNPGKEYFIDGNNAGRLKRAIVSYTGGVKELARSLDLASGLIGLGLNVGDVEDIYGNVLSWEQFYFIDHRVNVIYRYLLEIKEMVLQTESALLNALVSKVDLSDEALLIQELVARESASAMDQKENELIRIRQQQELQELQLQQSEAMLQQRNILIISAFAGIGLVLSLLVISTRAFYLKRQDNRKLAMHQLEISKMNEELQDRNQEIMAQNEEILTQRDEIEAQRDMVTRQKNVIERSHGEISASIDYARRLQNSILPSPGLLNTRIKDHFVVYMPKQRVSGDFYWWTQIEDHVVITAVDCTGHGVPGAFMSMLGVSMLREIVSKEYISHPGVILRRLRKEVVHALKQTGAFGEQKDGMDMALVSINVETLNCQYAGANNPLYLVREGVLTEYMGDRMPIAIHHSMDRFKTHEFQLQPGDHLYMFSDGFVDQFGGPEDKKFKFSQFRQLLVDHSTLPMKEQKKIIIQAHHDWRGGKEQVDDIVVLGLEI